jgi:hypothetical protein
MTVIRPNSISGITSLTAHRGSIDFYAHDGSAARFDNINSNVTSGVSTFASLNITGDLDVGGALTYEDVTNVDSIGVVTARNGINVSTGNVTITENSNVMFQNSARDTNRGAIQFTDGGIFRVRSGALLTERLRITSGGDIGIDCTPNDHNNFTRALDVNGPSGAAVYMRTNDSTSNCLIVGNYGSEAYVNNLANGNIRFYTQGTERLRIDPKGQASLRGTTTAFDGTGGLDALQIYYETDSGQASIGPYSSGGSTHLSFYTNSGGAAATEKLRITSSGNVGVKVTNPDLTLHVNGVNALPSTSGSTPAGHLTLRAKAQSSTHGMFMGVSNASPWSSWIQAQDASNNATNYPLLLNPNGGRVGINTNAPTAILDISHPYTEQGLLVRSRYGNIDTAMVKFDGDPYSNGGDGNVLHIHGGNSRTDSEILHIDSTGVGDIFDIRGDGLTRVYKQLQLEHSSNVAKIIFNEYGANDPKAQIEMDQVSGSAGQLIFRTQNSGTLSERMRIHSGGQVSINSTGYLGRLHIQQSAITEPALSIRHHDASLYKHMGTAGPNDRNGTDASNGRTYLHVRVRTVWNDTSMTMFRITGYYPYSDYTHSFVGMYRYGQSAYRTNPYGQTISNLKRATIHSIYNEAASPGYLVFVCDWPTNYTGLMFEHIGAGSVYGSYMQNDIEIIDSLRSTGTSALTF